MARDDGGASLPGAALFARTRYFAWRARHPNEADDPARAWAEAWREGGWDALHRSSQVAELIPRLEELIALYTEVQIEREIESGSAYWSTDEVNGQCV
jgi:hypothetical protein